MAAMRYGPAPLLEAEADRLIRESLKGVTSFAAKKDILTPWKEGECRRREVYAPSGVPSSIRSGIYRRALNSNNPELNSRGDGVMRPRSRGMSSLEAFVAEHRLDD